MTVHFLPTSDKETLEAELMARINPPKPEAIQSMEESPWGKSADGKVSEEFHRQLVGGPVRVEIPVDTPMQMREVIRHLKTVLDQADLILTEHIQNPPPVTGSERYLDWMVISRAKSVIRSFQRALPTRKTGKRTFK